VCLSERVGGISEERHAFCCEGWRVKKDLLLCGNAGWWWKWGVVGRQ